MQYYAFPFIFRPEIFTLNGCETSPFYTIPQIFLAKSCTAPQIASIKTEGKVLSSQNASIDMRGRHVKYMPYAFTESGIAMLSSVLRSSHR
jgi:hypothetical protein